jgi:hypothetical protein
LAAVSFHVRPLDGRELLRVFSGAAGGTRENPDASTAPRAPAIA